MRTFYVESAVRLRECGTQWADGARPGVIALSGELGAGKTTFAQGILDALGAIGPFTSPTFVLMKQYDLATPKDGISRVYHVDAYRVAAAELVSIGWEEWVGDPEGLVILEWPERAPNLVPIGATRIKFSVEGSGRNIEVHEPA